MQRFLEKDALRVVPAEQPGEAWSAPEHLRSVADLRAVLDSGVSAARLPAAKAEREIAYNRARPTRTAWIVLLLSLALGIAAWNVPRRGLDVAAGVALFAGFAVMSWGIGMRWSVGGRIPASNMYESLLFLAWGVGAFAVVATLVLRNRIVILNAAAMSALTMALTDLLPIDPFIHPMPPVLSGTYWLAVHVPIIMVGYAVLALGVVVAHMQLGFLAFAPSRRDTAIADGRSPLLVHARRLDPARDRHLHGLDVGGLLLGPLLGLGSRRRSGRSWPSSPTWRSCTRAPRACSAASASPPGASSPSRRS